MSKEKSSLPINFSYKGDSYFIDIDTLVSSQMHFVNIINEINRTQGSNFKLSIKIEAIKPGSFELNQLFEIVALPALFASPSVSYINNLISIVSNYINIKLFLKNKVADKVEKDGNSVTIHFGSERLEISKDAFNLYQTNYTINNSIVKLGSSLDKDADVDGVELTDKNSGEELLKLDREGFSDLKEQNGYLDEETKEDILETRLVITKPELNPKKKSKWNFVFKGRKINQVTISDFDFLQRVAKGELRFGNGDALLVDLKITSKFDIAFNVFMEKSFEVVKVKDIIYRNEQRTID